MNLPSIYSKPKPRILLKIGKRKGQKKILCRYFFFFLSLYLKLLSLLILHKSLDLNLHQMSLEYTQNEIKAVICPKSKIKYKNDRKMHETIKKSNIK